MQVYVRSKRISVAPTDSIGKGGEADVYRIPGGHALKVFKGENHPDHLTVDQRQAARIRIEEHQQKLTQFPRGVPSNVIVPLDVATDRKGKIVGYVMDMVEGAEPLLRYGEKSFRHGVNNNVVNRILKKLAQVVEAIHEKDAVVGDFNDLNVLVKGDTPYVIDADSWQFRTFPCRVYTERFVDPLLCDARQNRPVLVRPHNEDSDWYAFAVMVMQTLMFVDPYGGVFRPKDKKRKVPHPARPLHRITVFDSEVKYPKPARPLKSLPDDLADYLRQVFEKDTRGPFPLQLLNTQWRVCPGCGFEHARKSCPECQKVVPLVKEVVKGNVEYKKIFSTKGTILFAAMQDGQMRWLYWEDGHFWREGGVKVLKGSAHHQMRFRICGNQTLIGMSGKPALVVDKDGKLEQLPVDFYGNLPIFDANGRDKFWLQDGVLYRDDILGYKRIGDVLRNQTLFWVGPEFGLGFYRAGQLSVAFVFDVNGKINDSVNVKVRGQLIDSTCFFGDHCCWFFVSTQQGKRKVNECHVVSRHGEVLATEQTDQADHPWLSGIRGKWAFDKMLLSASDEGLRRIRNNGGLLEVEKEFPDTEPFVNEGCHLFAGKNGVYVTGRQEVGVLSLK